MKKDITPKSADAVYNLALSYFQKNEYDEAIKSFKDVLEIDPKYVAAWYDLGYIYKGEKEYDKAIEHYNKALEISPEYADAWHGLALSYYQQNEYEKAIEYTKNALEIDPEYQQAWQTLGGSHYGKKEYDKAIECYKNALELDQGIANSWYGLGLSYYAKRKNSKAIECYKNALAINPEIEIAWDSLNLAYTTISDFKNAERARNRENLLIPKLISKQEFDNKTKLMEKKGITIESDLSASELKDIIQSTITECNFALRQELREKQEEDSRNFEAYAQGIYDKQDVALSIVVEDLDQGSKLVVNAMSNKFAKLTDVLKDCSVKLDEIKSDTQLIKEYSSQIEDIFEKLEKLEDIENYLQQKLASDWDKIKETWQRYKSKEIDIMEFLKDGTKIVGKRFIKMILGNYI